MPLRYYLLLASLGLGAAPLAWGAWESGKSDVVRAIVARGTEKKAKVVFKTTRTSRASKGSNRTTTYWVDLEVEGRPEQRQVDSDVWGVTGLGEETPWYEDPAVPEGFAALEIGRRTDNEFVPYLLGFFLVFVIRGLYRRALPKPAKVGPGRGSTPEPAPPRLPEPPRDGAAEPWAAFSRGRLPSFLPLALCTAGLSAGLAGLFAERGFWGAAVLAVAQGLGALLTLVWNVARLRSRETALWLHGAEAPAYCTYEWIRGASTRYEGEFLLGDKVWHLEQEIHREVPKFAEQGKPMTVLADPRDPRRATLVP